MSVVDDNPSATSSVESESVTLSAAPALGDSVGVTARESSVISSEPELQFPRETETTVDAGHEKTVRATFVEPQIGKRRLTSWCWQVVSRFAPSLNGKNTMCLVKQQDGKTCNHLTKWTPSDGSKQGTGTSGLIKHLEVAHPDMVKKVKDETSTSVEGKAPSRAEIASSARALSSSSLVKYMVPKMHRKRREMADLRYVVWCCINLRPRQMRYEDGFKLFVGILSPEYVDSTMSTTTFDKTLDILYDSLERVAVSSAPAEF